MEELIFIKFKSEHYEEYKSWFENKHIKAALYDIEGEWLDFVLNDTTGIEYAIFKENTMVAVIGIQFPTKNHPYYVIQNIAINPSHFRKGIGRMVIEKLLSLHPLSHKHHWLAYVETKNHIAQKFFGNLAWTKSKCENDDNMVKFHLRIPSF